MFATLSTIPGFNKWLESLYAAGDPKILLPAERKALKAAAKKDIGVKGAMKEILSSPDWHQDDALTDALKAPLMRLCARDLVDEKRGAGRAADPVANFHLSNGARIQHIRWMADVSRNGIKQSAGMMVNYHYRLNKIVSNHESYRSTAKVYASKDARSWLN